MEHLRREHTDDLVRELTRRIAPAGFAGHFAIEYDREQKPRKLRCGQVYAIHELSRFDELLELPA